VTATPPRADQVEPSPQSLCDHPVYVHHIRGGEPLTIPLCQLCGEIGWDDLREQVVEHRRMVLTEVADELRGAADRIGAKNPDNGLTKGLKYGASRVRRLAAAAPPAGLSAPVPADPDVTAESVDDLTRRATDCIAEAEAEAESGGLHFHALRFLVRQLGRAATLAIAHDRQPYPTAHAYEQVCAALHKAEVERDRLAGELYEVQVMIERLTVDDDAKDGMRRAWLELEHWRTVIVPELMEQRDRLGTDRDRLAAQVAQYQRVVEAAKAWRAMRLGTPTQPKPESSALIAAVDALSDAGTDQTEGDHG
jgi:hypothetical protein